jgi:hypothetical protein
LHKKNSTDPASLGYGSCGEEKREDAKKRKKRKKDEDAGEKRRISKMISAKTLAVVGFLAVALIAAPAAWAGVQMYQGSWIAQSFGNDKTTGVETESDTWSVFAMPEGNNCNGVQPRCSISLTGALAGTTPNSPGLTPKQFDPLAAFCVPLTAWGLNATRPAKGLTATTGGDFARPIPPLFRDPAHFTAGGAGRTTACTDATTALGGKATNFTLTTNDPRMGIVMKGAPVRGTGSANTTSNGAFTFAPAPATRVPGVAGGMRRTTTGSASNFAPYLYSYTYATFRNATANFAQAKGFFTAGASKSTASFPYAKGGGGNVANSIVKKGAGNFGGTMRLLGRMTTKVCYFRAGGCSLGENDWRYDVIGTGGLGTSNGVLTSQYTVMYSAIYYQTLLMQQSTIMAIGDRFPWTTGNITVTATGRGPNKTFEKRHGYDNRVAGVGQVQLVSPIITKWLQPAANFETGGIAVLRINFVPEPVTALMLVAGLSLLGVLYRARGR